MVETQLTELAGLVRLFQDQQRDFLIITPPDPDIILFQPGGTFALLELKGFPKSFRDGLTEVVTKDGRRTFPIWMHEDAGSRGREIIVENIDGKEIARIPRARGYSPDWLVRERHPRFDTYSRAHQEWLLAAYDPSRVNILYDLIVGEDDLIEHVWVQSIQTFQQVEEEQLRMILSGGGEASTFRFVAMNALTNGAIELTLAWPENGLSNDTIDIFACTDLNIMDWEIVLTTNVNVSAGSFIWIDHDTANHERRFYDVWTHHDSDGDGLTDGREIRIYGTNPYSSDTSGNGIPDGWLVEHGFDPLDPTVGGQDPDGDGLTNWQEYIFGSDPTEWDTSGNGMSDGDQYAAGYDPSSPTNHTGHGWFLVVGDRGQDIEKSNSRTYTIPAGETWAFDVYLHSDEYPVYTGQGGGGSQFNDILAWSLMPSQGQGLSGSIGVNSRHQHWVTAEQEAQPILGFSPVHLEETVNFTAPANTSMVVNVTISAKNVADGLLPSTAIIYPRPNPVLENTADETENHDSDYALTRDPINVINGSVTLTERDIFIPAPGLPLAFERYYHSHGAQDSESAIGGGWRHSYDLTLASRTNATYKGVEGDWLVLSTPDGQRHWFREDNGGWLSPPENNLRLSQQGAVFQVESPAGIKHSFDANGMLQSIADAFGNMLTFSYNGAWPNLTLTRVEHDNGQFLDFASSAGRITSVTTPSGELSLTLQYAPSGLLTNAVRHISGTDETFGYYYDAVHNVLTQRVNAVGHRFDYDYDFDAPGGPRGISMQLEDVYYAHTINYTNQGPNRTEVTYDRDGVSQSFVYAYDATRKTISGIYGPNSMDYGTVMARDARMNVTGETLFDNILGEYLVTGREFDERNNVIAESVGYNQAPATQRWHYAWHEDWNLPTEMTDPDGVVQQWEYSNGRPVIARISAPGEDDIVTTFGYRADGLPSGVTNAAGHATTFDYDVRGNLSLVIPAAGPTVQMNHSVLGHLQSLVMPYGATNRVTSFDTDAAGRVIGVTLPDYRTSFTQFDLMGRMTNHVDFAGRTNQFEYLPGGRLAKTIRYLDGQPVGIRTDFDSQFNLLRVTDELDRNVETYALDVRDRVVAVTNLEQQVMSVQYGVADIVHSVTRFDGTAVSNAWDNQGRLAAQVFPDATNTFNYTPGGRLASVSGSGVTVTNIFDGFMRPVGQQTLDAGPQRGVTYAWNTAGQLAGLDTPAGARSYGHDPAERLTSLVAESGSFAWTYNPDNGAVATVANAQSGIGMSYGYDITDRLTGIAWSGTIPAMSFSMQYSHADMITNVVYTSGEERVYEYDDLDRLRGERHYDASEALTHSAAYEYDLAGNRTQTVINGVTNTYTLGLGNRLDTWTGGSYDYDLAGNVTDITDVSRPDLSLTWNSQYQLTGVSTNGTLAETYGYDPLGRRAWTADGSVTNWHVHDGMHVVADLDAAGTVLRSYTWGPGIDNLLAITVHGSTETNTYLAITDHLGTVHALADENGAVVESYRFDAWGNVLGVLDGTGQPLSETSVGNRFLFQGREYSWATGLYNFRARWYDPITGRWLSKDPIGINGGLNQYVAFGNNPVRFRDPLGLREEKCSGGY